MKNILLYYSFSFSFGGGEHLPLSFIAALQRMGNLTVALDMEPNLEKSSKLFGIDIDMAGLKVVQVTPSGYDPRKHDWLASYHRSRHLRKLAEEADICISCANIMDFGKPAHHFINMLAFGDDAFTDFAHNRVDDIPVKASGKAKRFLSDCVRPILGMRSKKSIIKDRKEHIYPNSHFVERLMTDYYGPFNSTVFYPPTLFEARQSNVLRDPLKIVYIGRIVPEKRIMDIIGIAEKAREISGLDIKLHIAGRMNQVPSYGKRLLEMEEKRDWLKFVGELYGQAKEDFLLSGSYALHTERFEAFGISIGEYLKSGIITIVPDVGGAREIVDSSELSFQTNEEAASILSKLLTDRDFREKQREHCLQRADYFSRGKYMERQQNLLNEIIAP